MKILTINQERVKEIIAELKNGKVIICPTDTVYGLIADAGSKTAVKKIFKIKGRKFQKTLPIFVKDIKTAKGLAFIDDKQEEFLKKVWPGKITAVLKPKSKAKKFFKFGIISSENKIGLRIPNYKLLNFLLEKLNAPITGTSANISGKPAPTKIAEILKQFENRKHQPDLVIDAGDLPKSKPSKVLDLTIFPPKILRE